MPIIPYSHSCISFKKDGRANNQPITITSHKLLAHSEYESYCIIIITVFLTVGCYQTGKGNQYQKLHQL